MGRGTMRDPFLDIEKSDTTISEVNKNRPRRNQIAIALCLSLFLVGGAGIAFFCFLCNSQSYTMLLAKSNFCLVCVFDYFLFMKI